jgi:hypothetical protein
MGLLGAPVDLTFKNPTESIKQYMIILIASVFTVLSIYAFYRTLKTYRRFKIELVIFFFIVVKLLTLLYADFVVPDMRIVFYCFAYNNTILALGSGLIVY